MNNSKFEKKKKKIHGHVSISECSPAAQKTEAAETCLMSAGLHGVWALTPLCAILKGQISNSPPPKSKEPVV